MTMNYTPGGGAKDDVRLLIGDTNTEALFDSRLEDEDIERLLVLEGGVRRSAARAADILAAKFARKAESTAIGQDRNVVSTRAAELRATARELRQSAAAEAIPTAGGITQSSKDSAETNTDRVAPAFRRGMLDNPDASSAQP